MAGVRLRHPTLTNVTVTVPIPHRPYRLPVLCSVCRVTHHVKTYHLSVDDQGAVIVTQEILERLREVRMAGFELANEVEKPPQIRVKIGGSLQVFDVMEVVHA